MRRPDTHPSGVWAPLLITLLLVLFDAYEGPKTQYVGVLTAMPLLAAALTRPLLVALVGAAVTAMAFGSASSRSRPAWTRPPRSRS